LLSEDTGIICDNLVAEWPQGVVQLDVVGELRAPRESDCARNSGAAEG
jgi:hypothetical protein